MLLASAMQLAVKEKTGHRPNLSQLAEVLVVPKVTGLTEIDLSVENVIAKLAKSDPKHYTVSTEPAKPSGDAKKAPAKKRTSGRHSGASHIRSQKAEKRAPRDRRILPGDLKVLEEVQAWVDLQRLPLPSDFKPSKTRKGTESGTMSYLIPRRGWVENVPAVDFARMQNGSLEWKVLEPERKEVRAQADRLAGLSFQAEECRVCNKPIPKGRGPEVALVYQLLYGRFVLPWINHPLVGGQTEARFRRAELICALLEEELVNILMATGKSVSDELIKVIEKVTTEAQKKVPNVTEDEIIEKLDDVLAYIEKQEEA